MAPKKQTGDLSKQFHVDTHGHAPAPWTKSPGTYISGSEAIDELDRVAIECESKWGCDRLRLLVPIEWREKFDRQRYLTNQAIFHGDLPAIRKEAARMVAAWKKLDALATESGAAQLNPTVWEVALPDGSVAAIVKDSSSARHVAAQGRCTRVYTLEEIGRLLHGFPTLAKAKDAFPGASVTAVRKSVQDPLEAVLDTMTPLDDAIPF